MAARNLLASIGIFLGALLGGYLGSDGVWINTGVLITVGEK